MTDLRFQTLHRPSTVLQNDAFERFAIGPVKPTSDEPYPPPVILETDGQWIPVTAHGRLLAMAQKERESLTVAVVPAIPPGDALALCARDLAWFEPLNEGHRATAVGKFLEFAPDAKPHPGLASALDLEPTAAVFDRYARIRRLGASAMEALFDGRLSIGCAHALIDAPAADRSVLVDLFTQQLSPNRNTARRIAQNAVAAAVARAVPIVRILSEALNASVREDRSGPQNIAALDRALYRMRYPVLSQAQQKAEQEVVELGLPKTIRVALPPHLEGGRIEFSVSAKSIEEIRSAAVALEQAISQGGLEKLFRRIGE